MQKIKVGLILNYPYEQSIPVWIYTMLERITASDYAEIVLIIRNRNRPREAPNSRLQRMYKNRRHLLYFAYRKFENKYRTNTLDAFKQVKAEPLVGHIPAIEVFPRQKSFSDYLTEDDITRVKDYDLDVILFFGNRILRGGILKAARYGVWSYHHGDNTVNRGYPACAWEFLMDWPVTGSTLQILSEELDGGQILYKSYSLTDPTSIQNNMNKVYWKTLSFMPRMLERLYRDREHFYEHEVVPRNQHPKSYTGQLFKTPTNMQLLQLMFKKISKRVFSKISNSVKYNQWGLYFYLAQQPELYLTLFRFKRMTPPKDRFWADPFVVCKNDTYYIFIEEFIGKTRKGHISVIEMDSKGNYGPPMPILAKVDKHLSYPFIFEHEDKYYMVPETGDSNTIELYECVDFPYQWEFKMNLMENVKAVDSNIIFYDDKWWLFTNIRENEGATTLDELFVFYADNPLTSDWKPHAQNPVLSDVRRARSAGAVIVSNGKLYRPAQISVPHYGWGISLEHIIKLSETEFEVEIIGNLTPDWEKHIEGVHTLAHAHKLTVIDALVSRYYVNTHL